jgi:hypothetical protein
VETCGQDVARVRRPCASRFGKITFGNAVRSDKQTYNSETGFMSAEFSRLTRLIDNEIILQTHFE